MNKVGVVGCGALGSYYGAGLCRLGLEVHYLLRTDHQEVEKNGVHVQSANGDFQVRPNCASQPGQIGPCDLVVVGLKTTANNQFPSLLPPLVDGNTALLTLQNGLGNEAKLAELFPANPIYGGLCFVCLNRVKPGVIHHIAHGKIVMGRHGDKPDGLCETIASLFRQAGFPVNVAGDLEKAHWEKLIWNVPFNGLGVASAAGYQSVVSGEWNPDQSLGPCLPTSRLLDGGRWEQLVAELMDEIIGAANELDLGVDPGLGAVQRDRTRVMGDYRASTLVDFERGLPLELDGLFEAPFRRARKVGVSTPRLEALCRILAALDPATRRA